ncbi:MAG: MBL fold metallo-hydrolase [Candidatus Saccharimonadales bacterium]
MKVTRLPQSCLLLEKEGKSIVIDPGDDFLKSHSVDEIKNVLAVLYTHQHADHYEPAIAAALIEAGVAVYANGSTARLIGDEKCNIVNSTDAFNVGQFEIVSYEIPHCLLPNGEPGPQNTGYVIDGALFHPGDGKDLDELELQVDNLALPITGPDISMLDACNFTKQVGAKVAIPIHYDKYGAKPEAYKHMAERLKMPFTIHILADGESTQIK